MPERALAGLEQADGAPILKSRLVELQEEERRPSWRASEGRQTSASGVKFAATLHPYQQVKDLRTGHEVGNAQGVLDGNLDGFVREYLLAKHGEGGLAASSARIGAPYMPDPTPRVRPTHFR